MVRVSKSAVILRNIASNWIGFLVNAAVTLVLTPYVLHELGVARYGIWILTSSFIGYYGFLDLGFRAGVTQYLTRYIALRDFAKASECISSAAAALSALGVIIIALSVGGAYVAPYLFTIPVDMTREAFWCIVVVGVGSALQIIFSPYSSVFTAVQRFDLSNLIGIGTRLLTAGGIVAALRLEQGLVGVSLAFCGANVIDYLIRWRVARHLVPELDVTLRHASLVRLREIASFGGWNFLISLNTYFYSYVPNMLIGAFMPIAAVGYYALATGLLKNVNSVLTPVGQVFYPVAVEVHAKGNRQELARLYHDGSRLMILAMISVVLAAMFWSEDFYRLWIGEKYVSGEQFPSVAFLFQILLISTLTSYITNTASQILVAAGRVKTVARILICGSALNLVLTLTLIRPYGLVGIAAAAVIASVAVDFVVLVQFQKIIGLSIREFLLCACIRPAAVGALQAMFIFLIRLLGKPEDWYHLALQGFLACFALTIAILVIGITATERERFIVQPIQRLFPGFRC